VAVLNRRIGLLFGTFLLLLFLAVGRAAWLGTVRASDMRERALSQQVADLTIPARRGTITDRHGAELAVSEDAITVFANPFLIKNPARTAARLAPLLGVPDTVVLEKLADRSRGFVYLRRRLDATNGHKIKKLEIEGIDTVVEPRRQYPQDHLAAQLLGTVGIDNVGLAGVEQSLEKKLHGSDGKRRVVRDALGEPVSIVEIKRALPGNDVRLTIDAALQERVEAIMAEVGQNFRPKGATAVVTDPRTGAVLALANWPRVDANDVGGAPGWARQNRTVGTVYEPGSTFKSITVAGALEEGLITPDTPFGLPPTLQVADRVIKEAHDRGGVTLTVAQILAQSSNIGSVKIGLMLGRDRFDKWVRRFGFGSLTDIELPGESAGIVAKPEDYSGSSLGNMPIGQGIAVTPVQMAAAYGAIANGGVLHKPYVVSGDESKGRRVISAKTSAQVSKMLEGVLAAGGTASEAAIPGYTLAGKTGTAEKANPLGGYSKDKYIASFIGFAPAKSPRLLVAVMVDEPKGAIYGGVVAAPAFQKILAFALPYLRIPPQ
jgi:cell division protein FtsI/penicillin-binding protein 2